MNTLDCKTKNDILLYMISNLRFASGKVMVGDSMLVLGFRQSMQISQVWFNKSTKKWGYHVSDVEYTGVPNLGEYNSFADLLYDVSTFYAKRWHIRDEPTTINITSYANSITDFVLDACT